MTRNETPLSACTRRTDEICTNGFSSSNWPETIFRRSDGRGGGGVYGEEGRLFASRQSETTKILKTGSVQGTNARKQSSNQRKKLTQSSRYEKFTAQSTARNSAASRSLSSSKQPPRLVGKGRSTQEVSNATKNSQNGGRNQREIAIERDGTRSACVTSRLATSSDLPRNSSMNTTRFYQQICLRHPPDLLTSPSSAARSLATIQMRSPSSEAYVTHKSFATIQSQGAKPKAGRLLTTGTRRNPRNAAFQLIKMTSRCFLDWFLNSTAGHPVATFKTRRLTQSNDITAPTSSIPVDATQKQRLPDAKRND
ncbi:hypothetical protein F511_36869 [Dorcoceras hygrometricum]|uniref:Uncharacterized protein n=1 Tax=Dorcoceras hygrometricum TaxID=472368 RepID=A0A2Z7CSW6_9LAMI|nr:hypothetical protein F511_36869 [Dorcoceras hygrometricum]